MKHKKEFYNVLVLGKDGRAHALIKSLSKSNFLGTLYTNNPHKEFCKLAEFIDLEPESFVRIARKCKEKEIDIVVPCNEKYLVDGISDTLKVEGINVFGPTKNAAIFEASKSYARDFCESNDIPVPKTWQFSNKEQAIDFAKQYSKYPIVLKADGLASGKGVFICSSENEAIEAIKKVFDMKIDSKGEILLIEEFLHGKEISVFALIDGKNIKYFGASRDYKSIEVNGKIYNTGGMGSFSPVKDFDTSTEQSIMRQIIYPTVHGMYSLGIKFQGVLFAGIMLTENGPKLLEYNVRFGDPEIQSLLSRLESDLLDLIIRTIEGKLGNEVQIMFKDLHSVCVVIANKGYGHNPQEHKSHDIIKIPQIDMPGVEILHPGTSYDESGNIIAKSAGRVLNIVATGQSLEESRTKAYSVVKSIEWPDGFYLENIAENT